MDRVKTLLGTGSVEGVVECDDTFFHQSCKVKYKENSVFKIPRRVYKRGFKLDPNVSTKEKQQRGLSKEQISVMVALDRSGTVISEPVGRGKISSVAIGRLFKDKIDIEAITCADSCRSFKNCKRI